MEDSQSGSRRGRGRGRARGRAGARARARGVSARALHFSIHTDEPVEPPQPAAPQPSTSSSFSEDLKKIKKNRVQEKNTIKNLSEEDRKRLQEMREKKQVSRFLMPDAPPPKKTKRTKSPERVPCPLYPGTPEIPPPRVPQPWEIKRRKIVPLESSGPSRCPDYEPEAPATNDSEPDETTASATSAPATPDRTSCIAQTLTPSTGVIRVDSCREFELVDAVVELVGFSPGPVPSPLPSTSSAAACDPASPLPSTSSAAACDPASPLPTTSLAAACDFIFDDEMEEDIRRWESCIGQNPGSDDEADVTPTTTAAIFRNPGVEEIPPHLNMVLESIDAMDDIALRELADEDMLHFDWSSDPSIFIGHREVFVGSSGPTFNLEGLTPFDVMAKIWDSDILDLICRETNRYADDLKSDPRLLEHSNIKKWTPISAQDLWTFFAIVMLQSLVPLPVESEYWHPRFQYLKFGLFENIMSFARFKLIKRCLHFVDNLSLSFDTGAQNRLAKIQPILDHLSGKFSSLYLPEQEIAIDESLLLWKGRLSFAQLINTKAARVGIKSYELCESRTGYLWKMILYAGKHQATRDDDREESEPEGATSKIVYNLVRPLLHKGYTLVMDNFYNSPLLSRTLKSQKTDTMGTLRLNREFVPDSLRSKSKANMRTGEVAFSQTRDLTIAVWKDANVVSLISSFHSIEVGGKEKYGYYRYKPKVVLDYNLAMGGVDKKDQLLQAFPVERVRNQVWYKKLFRRLLNVSIHNSHVLFSTRTKISAREFRYRLADEILHKFSFIPAQTAVSVSTQHFPGKTGKRKSRCHWCSLNKKDVCTVFKCIECNINLCIPDCFKEYHISRM